MNATPYPKGVNSRRLALIGKKRVEGLTTDEQSELDGCSRVMSAWLTQSRPGGGVRDVRGDFAMLVDGLRRKAKERGAS